MRKPPLATIESIEGYQPRVEGEPITAMVSVNRLADFHEAMDVEEENALLVDEWARRKAEAGRKR